MSMTSRDRHLATMLFGAHDRIPLIPGNGRKSTRTRWYQEGLPQDCTNIPVEAYRQAGGNLDLGQSLQTLVLPERMMPIFEEKVLEVRADSQVVQDWKGNVCEIGKEFTIEHLRNPVDFVTRRWIKCPVESRADWEDMQARYKIDEPGRFTPKLFAEMEGLKNRTHYLKFDVSGPFWILREWLGFENMCMLFIENPEWVKEMVFFWQEYIAQILTRSLSYVIPDEFHLSEDMAYKAHPMIGPDMTREFLLPCYRRWGDIIRKAGVPVYGVDSDGCVVDLIPVWKEAGVNMVDPMEVAAHNDLNAIRKEHGRSMAYRGGIDKRAMAKGGQAIVDEIRRLEPVIKGGGFIPSCDHGVPSDVSWPDYVRYTGLLAEVTGWLNPGTTK